MKNIKFKKLSKQGQKLLFAAKKVLLNAYMPYSHFPVGAALLSLDNAIIPGTNYENAAQSPGICAERTALVIANASGIRKFSMIAIIGLTSDIIAPCGVCRQMLFEASQISGVDIKVIMSNEDMSKIIVATISELLPLAFGPKDLGVDLTKFEHK